MFTGIGEDANSDNCSYKIRETTTNQWVLNSGVLGTDDIRVCRWFGLDELCRHQFVLWNDLFVCRCCREWEQRRSSC